MGSEEELSLACCNILSNRTWGGVWSSFVGGAGWMQSYSERRWQKLIRSRGRFVKGGRFQRAVEYAWCVHTIIGHLRRFKHLRGSTHSRPSNGPSGHMAWLNLGTPISWQLSRVMALGWQQRKENIPVAEWACAVLAGSLFPAGEFSRPALGSSYWVLALLPRLWPRWAPLSLSDSLFKSLASSSMVLDLAGYQQAGRSSVWKWS